MLKIDKERVEILKEFHELCTKNNIWYSIDDHMLIGLNKHSGFIPWYKKNQVMMTVDSYMKLKRLFPKNIANSNTNKDIKNFCVYYVNDKNNVKDIQPFIEIRLLIPTTIKKIKLFKNPLYKIKNSLMFRKIRLKEAINDLKDPKFEGYWLLNNRHNNVINSWIQTISFETIDVSFSGVTLKAIKEHKDIANSWFDIDLEGYTPPPSKSYEYLSPILTNRIEK